MNTPNTFCRGLEAIEEDDEAFGFVENGMKDDEPTAKPPVKKTPTNCKPNGAPLELNTIKFPDKPEPIHETVDLPTGTQHTEKEVIPNED